MLLRCFSVSVAIALFAGTTAIALPATPEGAAHLTEVMQHYLGHTPGVVSVSPEGETYRMALDGTPLLAAAQIKGHVSPYVMALTDLGAGQWALRVDQAFDLELDLPEVMTLSVRLERLTSTGLFDEALFSFSKAESVFANLSVTEAIATPQGGSNRINYHVDEGRSTMTATAAPMGGVDARFGYELRGLAEAIVVSPEGGPGASLDLTAQAQSYGASGRIDGLRTERLYALAAWLVAHPSEGALRADQEALKGLVGAALPLFDQFSMDGTMAAISLDTPVGSFLARTARIGVDLAGVVSAGRIREAIDLSGIEVPEALVPVWAKDLLPESVGFDIAVSRYDLAAPARMLLDLTDIAAASPLSPDDEAALLAAVLPEGFAEITFAPGHVTGAGYDLRFEGAMQAPVDGMPGGSGRVSLTGVEQIIAALNAVPGGEGREIGMGIAMLRGIAKPDGATLVWTIDATNPGKVLINDIDLMAFDRMGKP